MCFRSGSKERQVILAQTSGILDKQTTAQLGGIVEQTVSHYVSPKVGVCPFWPHAVDLARGLHIWVAGGRFDR